MIELIDKINNTFKIVFDDMDMTIHPLNREAIFLKDVLLEGYWITKVIFKENGSTAFRYKKIEKIKHLEKKNKNVFRGKA